MVGQNNDPGDDPYRHWYAYQEQWRSEIEPRNQQRLKYLDLAASYGQMGLRSVFILNGGGLIAMPAFAELVGTIWARGFWPPMLSIFAFVLGLIVAGIANALSLFTFMKLQDWQALETERIGTRITANFNAVASGQLPTSTATTPSQKELDAKNAAYFRQRWAIKLGISGLVLFIVGASLGAYIVSCGNVSYGVGNNIVCPGDNTDNTNATLLPPRSPASPKTP